MKAKRNLSDKPPRSNPITFEEVADACRELDSEGKKPTVTSVRDRVGSGSYSTIQRFILEWGGRREEHGMSPLVADNELESCLPALRRMIEPLIRLKLESENENRAERDRQAAADLQDLILELSEARGEIKNLERRIEDLQAAFDKVKLTAGIEKTDVAA